MAEGGAGSAYAGLISDQLAEERSRKASLEARGVSVITTSGVLVTVLFALSAGLRSVGDARLPGVARVTLLLALVTFVLAALFGLATNLPLRYKEPTPEGLAQLVDREYWAAPAVIGELRVAESKVRVLAAARAANRIKVTLLLVGAFLELLAVAFLAVAVANVLYAA
ncbi:hypothetical protein GCM10022251_76020 [Phytohabitans flavus]|uniref:Integral membrane plasmid transfer protein n=1 Tax=Phytohabitans flavus TaxID=1076124 RepID=A0A6F8XSZ2_9ACTN|nr:hypothetical protein [Phytohabitans flavus]BCB76954.1 hypothetical protein Pflav_033640 [Phytohabitans flavus]